MKHNLMVKGSTIFLRASVLAMGVLVLALCVAVLPAIFTGWNKELPEIAWLRYPVLIGLSVTALAFWGALYQAFKLLHYIDNGMAFSELSVRALKNIQYCGFIIGACYAVGLPIIYHLADQGDAPGVMMIGLIFTGAPLAIAVFASVMQRLLHNIIAIKSENDLTV